MTPSLGGILVMVALLALGHRLGSPIIVGLLAALPFGSTAIGTVGALGGSSPLVYVAFVLMLLAAVAMQQRCLDRLCTVFARHWTAWVVAVLIAYAVAGAVLFPRLFQGQTLALVPTPEGVKELPLGPASSNITQTGYFVLGALTFYAFAILVDSKAQLDAVRRGFLAFAAVHASLGIIDLAGKMSGLGDILWPIRTASYTYLVEVEEAGFWRIAGGFSEASSFGSVTLGCLAFSFAYWRVTRSRPVLALTIVLLCLLLLSTSSTAYAGFAIITAFVGAAMALAALRGRLKSPDLLVLAAVWLMLILVLSLYLANEHLFDPIVRLFETMVLNKASSESAQVRQYWNAQSLQAFLETYWLGVGLGSSRAASWLVAVISQLGLIGAVLIAGLVGVLIADAASPQPSHLDRETLALVSGVRAGALASLAGASVSSGFADPGLLFFIALAIVCVYRRPRGLQQGAGALHRDRPVQMRHQPIGSPRFAYGASRHRTP